MAISNGVATNLIVAFFEDFRVLGAFRNSKYITLRVMVVLKLDTNARKWLKGVSLTQIMSILRGIIN